MIVCRDLGSFTVFTACSLLWPTSHSRGNMLTRYDIGNAFKGCSASTLNTLANEMLAISHSRHGVSRGSRLTDYSQKRMGAACNAQVYRCGPLPPHCDAQLPFRVEAECSPLCSTKRLDSISTSLLNQTYPKARQRHSCGTVPELPEVATPQGPSNIRRTSQPEPNQGRAIV